MSQISKRKSGGDLDFGEEKKQKLVFSLINGIPALIINLGIKDRQMECRSKQTTSSNTKLRKIAHCTTYFILHWIY